MKKYTIKKGSHWAEPWWKRFIPRFIFGSPYCVKIKGMFEAGSEYELPDGDQEDVNKFPGLQYSLWPRTKKVQLGWRYNPADKLWEILIFQEAKPRDFVFEVIGRVKSEEEFEAVLYIFDFSINWNFSSDSDYEFGKINAKARCMRKSWAIALKPYFGGNQKAPKDIIFYLEARYF